jgi:hypothetical protein
MALTWREERPEAITAASHSAERPSRSMVMIFSALSSSSDVRTRFSRSLCGAGLLAGATAFWGAGFLGAGFLADLLAVFRTVFWPDFLEAAFLAGALAFFAGFRAGFLAAFRAKFL